uniref:Uncharacterized protein n=1 Tax=viral metagenome TaxID=1070528 RepID=A0A6C0HF89_9ZZZZ
MNDQLVSTQTKIIGEPINLSSPIQANPTVSTLGMNEPLRMNEPLPLRMNEPLPLRMNEPKINPIIPLSRGVGQPITALNDPNALYGSAPEIKIDPYRNQMPIVAPKVDNTINNLCPPCPTCPKCGCKVVEGFYGSRCGCGNNNMLMYIILLVVIFYLMKK